jgi:hypothetical protein
MPDRDPHPDSLPENDHDERSDVEQIVEPQTDDVERGDGGPEPETFTSPGVPDGVEGTGGVTRNRDDPAQ